MAREEKTDDRGRWVLRKIIKLIIFEIQKSIEVKFSSLLLRLRRVIYGYPFRRIPLSQGKFAIVDPEDYERLNQYKWHAQKDGGGGSCYALSYLPRNGRRKRKKKRMHRMVIEIPEGFYCDHINQNGLDNRKANLRPATWSQNLWNRKKYNRPSSSKFKGVEWVKDRGCWRAMIQANRKKIYVGYFRDEIDAARAYDAAARKYHGEFACPNF